MATFARASGQHLNTAKTNLLLVGAERAPLPPAVLGLQCASHTEALGCTIEEVQAGHSITDRATWEALLKRVGECFDRISSRIHFSAFGRSHLAASYGVSTLLHRAEFLPVPPDQTDRLSKMFKTLVDKASTNPQNRPPGVHSRLLEGRKEGKITVDQHQVECRDT